MVQITKIEEAKKVLSSVVDETPLQRSDFLSSEYECDIFLKREDLQKVRSYKIRGAYFKISSLLKKGEINEVVAASAGNHAQGVAFACNELKIQAVIFMPSTTPKQKINQVKFFGQEFVDIEIIGDTFDDSYRIAKDYSQNNNATFIPPFDDRDIVAGQGTVGLEIHKQIEKQPDFIFLPIGGGGVISGVGSFYKQIHPSTKIIGVEPEGAPSMTAAFKKGELVELESIDRFVDGAAVKKCGQLNFEIAQKVIDDIIVVQEGLACKVILDMYNRSSIVIEPAGSLSIAALEFYKEKIKGKTVVCLVSGGNNDFTRMGEIQERALLYQKLKHYYIVEMPQRAGALKFFLNQILGPNDDITLFEYSKKTNRSQGPIVLGIEVQNPKDIEKVEEKMKVHNWNFEYLNDRPQLFRFLV